MMNERWYCNGANFCLQRHVIIFRTSFSMYIYISMLTFPSLNVYSPSGEIMCTI